MSEYLKPTYDGPPSPSSFRSRLLSISKCACRWILALSALFAVTARVTAADIALLEQEAFREAIAAVADSVVQVRTVGGLDRVGKTLIAQGPTTGLIVSPNGYIVSSAFNFAQQPTSILVRLPDGTQASAKLIARDKNRMLALLKVEIDELLPVPVAVPQAEIEVGQWAIALGRTFRADRVGVSTGIISGLNRMYGRVLQTDASISVANYGGPLVDLRGRVFGILVPMSPQSGDENELAGAEYYDSGIGFAVPLEHVFELLPRWQQSEDLLPGKLGIGMVAGSAHLQPPKITTVWPNSPAALAGWQPDDLITEINGVAVATQAQLRFQVIPRYAGETLHVSLQRGDQTLESSITLAGELEPFQHAFLGVLPARTNSGKNEAGLLVRSVWPESPAALAGLQAEDRLLKIEQAELTKLEDALKEIGRLHPGESVELTVFRHEKELTLSANLTTLPEEILAASDLPIADTQQENKAAELQPLNAHPVLELMKLPTFSQEAKFYAPKLGENERSGLLVWLGSGKKQHDAQLLASWQETCQRTQTVLLIATPQEESRWTTEDLKFLERLVSKASKRFASDPERVSIGGSGKAGQLALALALSKPNTFSGAIGIDAPLPRTFKIPDNNPNRRIATLTVESRNSSFAPLIRRDLQRLREARYPASWLQRPPTGDVEAKLDNATQSQIARWLDTLDRF